MNPKATGGIACGPDGCVHLSADEVQAILDSADRAKAERLARIPDEESAIHALFDGWVRLKEMGWRDALYAPLDKPLELIEVGSTGIHKGYRDSERRFWITDGDTWPSSPCLWRLALELVVDPSWSTPKKEVALAASPQNRGEVDER